MDKIRFKQGIARGRRDDMPPADGSLTVAKIAADLRPSADQSAARTFLVAGSAAGSQRACSLGSCAMGQTDGSHYSEMPPRAAE